MAVKPPEQNEVESAVVVTVGIGLTVIVCAAEPTQPNAEVPVIVYTVVVVGAAVTVAPVVALNPVAGDQL
jgi:hypothetical protein